MKLNGDELELFIDGESKPVISVKLDDSFAELERIDNTVPSNMKAFEVGLTTSTIEVESYLYYPYGAELTGSLTKGTYLVSSGSLLADGVTYETGQLAKVLTTATASTSKVKKLGDAVVCRKPLMSYSGSLYGMKTFDYSVSFDTQDSTDSETEGNGSEVTPTKAVYEAKVNSIMRDNKADLFVQDPVKNNLILTLQSGSNLSISGDVLVTKETKSFSANDLTKVDSTFKFVSVVSDTIGWTLAEEKPFKLRIKKGTSTNKEYTGKCVAISKTLKCEKGAFATMNYSLNVNGAYSGSIAN